VTIVSGLAPAWPRARGCNSPALPAAGRALDSARNESTAPTLRRRPTLGDDLLDTDASADRAGAHDDEAALVHAPLGGREKNRAAPLGREYAALRSDSAPRRPDVSVSRGSDRPACGLVSAPSVLRPEPGQCHLGRLASSICFAISACEPDRPCVSPVHVLWQDARISITAMNSFSDERGHWAPGSCRRSTACLRHWVPSRSVR